MARRKASIGIWIGTNGTKFPNKLKGTGYGRRQNRSSKSDVTKAVSDQKRHEHGETEIDHRPPKKYLGSSFMSLALRMDLAANKRARPVTWSARTNVIPRKFSHLPIIIPRSVSCDAGFLVSVPEFLSQCLRTKRTTRPLKANVRI